MEKWKQKEYSTGRLLIHVEESETDRYDFYTLLGILGITQEEAQWLIGMYLEEYPDEFREIEEDISNRD